MLTHVTPRPESRFWTSIISRRGGELLTSADVVTEPALNDLGKPWLECTGRVHPIWEHPQLTCWSPRPMPGDAYVLFFLCSAPDSLLCSLMGVFQQRRIFARRDDRALVSSLTCLRSVTYSVWRRGRKAAPSIRGSMPVLGSSASSDRAASTDFVDPQPPPGNALRRIQIRHLMLAYLPFSYDPYIVAPRRRWNPPSTTPYTSPS